MDWSNERYVRLYTRETAEWRAFCWQAKACLPLMLMHADRIGLVAMRPGPSRMRLLAGLIGIPEDVVSAGVADLVVDGCLIETDAGFIFKNFIEAQEAEASNAKRCREYRERLRNSEIDTLRVATTLDESDADTKNVKTNTPSLAVPSRALKETYVELDSTPRLVEAPKVSKLDQEAQQVFEHWKQKLKHPRAVFDPKRKKAVVARLKEGKTVVDLKQAVDGCANTPHNMGSNDRGQVYDDLELICRDNPHVERFMANAKANGLLIHTQHEPGTDPYAAES